MSNCKVEKNAKNGKINKILDQSGNKSTLFQELLNVPTLSLNEAIEAYKNIYSDELKDTVRFQKGYHGTKQNLSKFSTDFIGTGNRSMFGGWGLYFTLNETRARGYANELAKEKIKIGDLIIENDKYSDNFKVLKDLIDANNSKLSVVKGLLKEAEEANKKFISQRDFLFKGDFDKLYSEYVKAEQSPEKEESKNVIAEFEKLERRSDLPLSELRHQSFELRQLAKKVLNEGIDYNKDAAYLYQVSFPEVMELFDFDSNISTEQYNTILNQAISENSPFVEAIKNNIGKRGRDFYFNVAQYSGKTSEKGLSLLMKRAGIDGNKMMSDGFKQDIIIFDENAIRIENQIQFQIIGEKGAKNLDQIEEATFRMDNLKVAREMEAAGKTPKEIRLATGWEKGVDGLFRYEIQDGTFNDVPLNFNVSVPFMEEPTAKVSLPEVYNNEELFKAYPKLKNTNIYVYDTENPLYDENKMFVYKGNIYINSRTYDTRNNTLRLSVEEGTEIAHEIQHLLQQTEGFATGSSVTWNRERVRESIAAIKTKIRTGTRREGFSGRYDDYIESLLRKSIGEDLIEPVVFAKDIDMLVEALAGKAYINFAGETEARNVQTRFLMSPQERLEQTLQETQSIPFEDQFVSQYKNNMQSSQRTAPQITQEIIDKLKQNGLSEDVFLLSTEEINAKLIELGVSEDVRRQVEAWHGSPYAFDRFTTNAMSTGEGIQAFGWGLYFTDLESIAKDYANKLAIYAKPSETLRRLKAQLWSKEDRELFNLITIDNDKINGLLEFKKALFGTEDVDVSTNSLLSIEERQYLEKENNNKRLPSNYLSKVEHYIYLDNIISDFYKALDSSRNLYKVSLHKGKTPSEYTWLEWDKRPSLDTIEQFIDYVSDNIAKSESSKDNLQSKKEDIFAGRTKIETGKSFYQGLATSVMQVVGKNTDKDISLALLESGIDGIKYPAESISRGATSDTARGFNYVVFDENAITIEEQIQFSKSLNNVGINLITNGLTYKDSKTGKDIVILNKDTADDSTSIHEFNHIFLNWAKTARPELYAKGIDLIKTELKKGEKSEIKDIFNFVKQTQPKLKGNALLEEYLTEFVGRESRNMMDEQKAKSPLMQWLSDFWESIKDLMGLTSMTPEQVANLNLKEFARASVADLLKGENIGQSTLDSGINRQVIGEKGASKIEEYNNLLNQAKNLDKQGKDYSETGWFKNEQGQWKYFSNEILNEFLDFPQIKNKTVNLKDLLKKDSVLLKAYPELEDTKIEFYEDTKDSDFRGDAQTNGTVTEEGETTILHIRTGSKGTADYGGILVHELNHKLQRIDNFARGGSPKFLLKLAIFITNSQNLPNRDAVNKIKNFDTSSLDKESKKIVEIVQKAFNNPSRAEKLLEDGYFLLQGEVDSRAVELALELKNKLGKDTNFTYSELVKELGKREGIDLVNEAISIFVDDVVLSRPKQTVVEPNATFNGFSSYSQAVKNTPINDTIKIDIAGVNVAEVTNNGDINDLIRQDIILDERELTPSGEIVFTTAGNSITKKLVNAEIAKEVIKGTINEDGNIVAKEKVELTKVSDDFNKNKKEFGETTALSILASQILLNNTPTLGNNRIIDYSIEIPSDNVLMTKLKNLLQELGIKTMSLEEWAKNYKTRTGQEPTANSLADISNRIIAFANGQVNQDTLSEEVMHFIVEALPQEQVRPLLDMIHKTDEWKQYAAQYTEIYKDDNTVRREILGKVLKNYIQSQQEQSTLQGQSVARRLLDMVDKFIAQIRGLFKPQHQVQLDKFTKEIYQKLMKEELYSELSPSQFDGNTLVMYQAEPSTIYDYLTKTLEAFDSLDRKTGGQNKFELSLLDVENRDELNQLKATAALSAIIKTKIKYLTKRGRQSGFLSVEEQQVYDVALNELAPTLGKLKNIISEKPFNNAFLKQQVLENVTQTMTELSELSTALNEDNQKVFDTLVEDVAEQTGLTPEMTEILKNEIKTLQRDTNQFYSLYGSLSQAQSPILNILSTVISDAERESIIQYDRRQSEFINAAKALGFKEEEIADQLKQFKDGYYFISQWDFEAIEKEKAVFKAEAYSEVTGTPITTEKFLKEEEKLLKKLPQKQRNTYNFKFKEKVDKSGMHHDRLTKEERAKANSLIEGFSEKTKRFLADQAKRKGAIAQRIKDNNGASKEDNNLLKELAQQRQKMANPYDEYGSLHKGLQINIAGEVSKSPTFDDFKTTESDREIATTILELAEYNKKIVAQYKAREAIEGKQPVPQSFIDKVQEIRGNGDVKGVAKAMEFLLMNTRISYNSNFWEMFEKTNGLIEKLRESSDAEALSTADDIQKNRTRLKNILKEHRDYNNPSQIDFENLGGAESTIKEISSDLEHLYEKAKSYLRDNETLKKTTESESITNKAYRDVIEDRGIHLIKNRKDYEARLDYILKHVTPNSRARILRNADSFISYKKGYSKKLPKSIEKFENRSKGKGFKETEEVATYEDILDYAESFLLPYFKELKPTNFDMQEFVTRLVKAETESDFNRIIEEAEYVTVTPSYSLVDSEDNKRLNPEYAKAYEANDPTINLDYEDKNGNKILRNTRYSEMFLDANGKLRKDKEKQKQLLDLTVGFWADSIESANMTDSFSKYQLPGIRRGSLARKEQLIKNFSAKNLRESIKDIITVREDDPIFGQAADMASRGALTIPRIGFSKLETAEEVTDELLYSLMHTANQAEKRKQRISSLDKIEAVKTRLRGASYGDKTGEATTAYKMADDFIRYNIYGQTETFKWETDFFGMTSKKYNLAPVIKHFQGWTRLVGLGYSTLVPLTSFLQGSTNFVVENIVGDRINTTASRLAARKAGQLVAKATKEEFMSDLKTKSELNLLMQFFGLSNPIDNFQNSNYGRTLRGLAPENSAYFSHFMGDLPLTAQTIMTVLYDFKVVEIKDDNGFVVNTKLQSYSEWRNDNKALRIAGNIVPATEKEAIAEWKLNDKYLYNYIETKKDGNSEIVGMQMNSEYYKIFAGKEKYANDRLNFVKRKITTVKQEIDNQIPNEDKSYIQRHAIFSFISMFKGFLITSVNKRFKDRHRSNQTNMLEEGTYKGTSAFLGALINSGRKGSFKDFWKEQYREFDGGYKLVKEGDEWNIYDTNKEGENKLFSSQDENKARSAHAQLTVQATQMRQVSLKRAGLDFAVTASLATIALLLKGLADDDDDDYVKEFAAYMSYRVAVETTSQSTGLGGQLYSFIQSPTAGISQINNLINIGDLGSSEITKSGTYRGYSERDALLYRSLPIMKEYFRLKEIDRSRDDYKKYNKHFIDNFNMAALIFDEEARK